jgi:hypothetical protein
MVKHVGLALCLCLMAMGLNGVFATRNAAQQHPQESARSVTNGSTALIASGTYANREAPTAPGSAHLVPGKAPLGTSAQCRDGSYTASANHRDACLHHGGVARWL